MKDLRKDYLLDETMVLYQHQDHFHFNTDTKLLANFMRIKKKERVLDIGTNNGALLLAVDRFPVQEMIGVEILEGPAQIAQMNVDTFFQHPTTILCQPIQETQIDPVDVIVSNPPFFSQKSTNPQVAMNLRQLGRIEENLSLEELIFHANRLLKSNGRFYFVHRLNRLNEIFDQLHKHRFQVRHLQIAYTKKDGIPKSVCIEAIKESQCDCIVDPPIFI